MYLYISRISLYVFILSLYIEYNIHRIIVIKPSDESRTFVRLWPAAARYAFDHGNGSGERGVFYGVGDAEDGKMVNNNEGFTS